MTIRIALVALFLNLTDALVAFATDAEIDTLAFTGLLLFATLDAVEPQVVATTTLVRLLKVGIAIRKRVVGRSADDVAQVLLHNL